MNEPIEATALVSFSGSLMGLFGLLVSLFSVQLGNWLSKLKGLRTKWDLNNGNDDKELSARREVRYALVELYNWQPLVMTIILAVFASGVVFFFNDVRLSEGIHLPSIFPYLYNAFFIVTFVLQIVLLIGGYTTARRLNRDIEKWLEDANK